MLSLQKKNTSRRPVNRRKSDFEPKKPVHVVGRGIDTVWVYDMKSQMIVYKMTVAVKEAPSYHQFLDLA